MRWKGDKLSAPLPPTAGALPTFALCVQTRHANGVQSVPAYLPPLGCCVALSVPSLVPALSPTRSPRAPPLTTCAGRAYPVPPPSTHGAHTPPPLRTNGERLGEREATHERYAPLFFSCPRSLEQDSERELCLPPPYMQERGHSSTPQPGTGTRVAAVQPSPPCVPLTHAEHASGSTAPSSLFRLSSPPLTH